MNDQLKRFFLIGLGLTVISKDKAEKFIHDLTSEGNAAANEAKSYLSKLNDKGKSKKNEWKNDFKEEAKEAIADLGFVTIEEYNKLKERLENLEKQGSKDCSLQESNGPENDTADR